MSSGNFEIQEYHHARHFDDAEHEYDSAKQGMWLFLVSEVLMFGAIFVGYGIYYQLYPEAFEAGAGQMKLMWGTINTAVLIGSSFTVAEAIRCVQMDQLKKAAMYVYITIGCGLAFMVIKGIEYSAKFSHGFFPGRWFAPTEGYEQFAAIPKLDMYFGFYYTMTGLHALHVIFGLCGLIWALVKIHKGTIHSKNYMPIEGAGLFWHLVDLVWIFLFPVLYIVG